MVGDGASRAAGWPPSQGCVKADVESGWTVDPRSSDGSGAPRGTTDALDGKRLIARSTPGARSGNAPHE